MTFFWSERSNDHGIQFGLEDALQLALSSKHQETLYCTICIKCCKIWKTILKSLACLAPDGELNARFDLYKTAISDFKHTALPLSIFSSPQSPSILISSNKV